MAMLGWYGPPPSPPEVKSNPAPDPVNIPVSNSPVLAEVRPGNKPEKANTHRKGRPKATGPTVTDYRNMIKQNRIRGASRLNVKSMRELLNALQLI